MCAEFCFRCQTVQHMTVTISHKKSTGANGEVKEIEITTLHCERCKAFVRSEETTVERSAESV